MPESRNIASMADRSFRARLTGNFEVSPGYMMLTFRPQEGFMPPAPRPGQFYMVSAGPGDEPLLKRPFCYFDLTAPGEVSILYKVHGRGTRIMSALGEGASIKILGPLGNTYPSVPGGKSPVIVAGGIGIASVMPLIRKLGSSARVVFGARTASEMVMRKEVGGFLCELHGCTDDGTVGMKGNVVDMLRELGPGPESVIYACGPTPMTRAVVAFARERDITGYASLEEHMACGIGACMGCVVMTTKGYRRVCKEGPVFRMEDLLL